MSDALFSPQEEPPSTDSSRSRLERNVTLEEMQALIQDAGIRQNINDLMDYAAASIDKNWYNEVIDALALASKAGDLVRIGYFLRSRGDWGRSISAFATALDTEGLTELREHFIQNEMYVWVTRVDRAIAYCEKEKLEGDALDGL